MTNGSAIKRLLEIQRISTRKADISKSQIKDIARCCKTLSASLTDEEITQVLWAMALTKEDLLN